MEKLLGLLNSRKFYAAVIALVFVFVDAYVPGFPLSEEQVLQLVLVQASYILGVAIEGFRKS